MPAAIATCIGCGCDDNHACEDGCYWLRVDRRDQVGVCSECDEHLDAWDRGDRTPHAMPAAEIEAEEELQDKIRRGLVRVATPDEPKPAGEGPCGHSWPFEQPDWGDACRWCGRSFAFYAFCEAE